MFQQNKLIIYRNFNELLCSSYHRKCILLCIVIIHLPIFIYKLQAKISKKILGTIIFYYSYIFLNLISTNYIIGPSDMTKIKSILRN